MVNMGLPVHKGQLSRRRFALAVPLLGSLSLLAPVASWATTGPQRAQRALMGTQVDIVTDGASAGLLQVAMNQAFERMQALEAMMSRFQPHSVLQQINAQAGKQPVAVPPEMMAVLQHAQHVWEASQGAFDPTIGALAAWRFEPGQQAMPTAAQIARALPHINAQKLQLDTRKNTAYLTDSDMALDLGGVAKLPILAAGQEVLKAHGIKNALINGGGDVLVMGQLQDRAWRIGVRDPRQPEKLLGTIAAEGQAVVASSGDYERYFERDGQRYHHVLNPHTGWPTTQVHGVALLARDIAQVNGWGTALMVQGPAAAPAWSAQHGDVGLMLAAQDGQIWSNTSMQQALQNA